MPISQIHKAHPLLTKFSLHAVQSIFSHGSLIRLEPNQVLYAKDDLTLKVYLIVYGAVQLYQKDVADITRLI